MIVAESDAPTTKPSNLKVGKKEILMSDEIQGQELEVKETPDVMTPSEKPAEVAPEGLPEDASERTKQEFEKLKAHNKQLAEELAKAKTPQAPPLSVFDQFRPQQGLQQPPLMPQQQQGFMPQGQNNSSSLVDADGYLDAERLQKTVTSLEQRASNAENEARRAREEVANFQVSSAQKQVFAKYPELDPNSSSFDPNFTKRVTNEIFGQLTTSGREDYMDAADTVAKLFPKQSEVQTSKEQAVNEYKDTVSKKEQINTDTRGVMPSNQAELVRLTRKGDSKALDARLKALGL